MSLSSFTAQTTDPGIQAAVRAELEWTPDLEASNIGVSVRDGVVQLSGETNSLSERYIAVKVAQHVLGVTTVVDDIIVAGEPGTSSSDIEIARAIRSILSWFQTIPHSAVDAEVRDGHVVLTGTLEWDYQRRSAERVVQTVRGVQSVSNRIELSPRSFSPDTADEIRDALNRRADLDATAISIHAEEARVVLGGVTKTLGEKYLATRIAWKHPGILDVRNNIRVGAGRELKEGL